jgi:hypothetical protein
MPKSARCRSVIALLLAAAPGAAAAFGADGHRIAGLLAAPLLCERATQEIAALVGSNRSLEDLGYWADTIRDDPAWRHSSPWHYINVPDDGALRAIEHPPEGDVLWAIDHFSRVLADGAQPEAARAVALQFLIHFIVDVHQPLHVGRAEDRGGNTISVRYGRTTTDLHAFWDGGAIARRELAPERYARRLEPMLATLAGEGDADPVVWAEESLALRSLVYGFDAATGELDRRYLDAAESTVERRVAQAALRLAGTLNRIYCGP